MSKMNFIDVSNHQAGIKLAAVQSECFVFKSTEGRGWKDSQLNNFTQQARSLDKPVGFYHYVSQGNTPEQEASNMLLYTEGSGGRRDNDLLVLDWEPTGSNPSKTNVHWAREFLEFTRERVGNPLWTYMNLSTANGSDWRPITSRFPLLWLAHYPGSNTAQGYSPAGPRGILRSANEWQLAAWQFTDGGQLPGYSGKLDLNELYTPWWNDPTVPVSDPIKNPVGNPLLDGMKYKIPWPLPSIAEPDPWIELVNSHGDKLYDSRGRPRKGCICMQIVLVLVEREMIRRGIIKHSVDVFQAGYNPGGVAASAGTHDMGGVYDVAQGITLAQREVWAMFGAMCAPRTREWGWTSGDHGHLVIHGCVHRSLGAYRQIIRMMQGYNGLVSDKYVNWVKPGSTWQDAVKKVIESGAPVHSVPTPTKPKEADEVPEIYESPVFVMSHGGSTFQYQEEYPAIGADVIGPIKYQCDAVIEGPADSIIETRWATLNRKTATWTWRSDSVVHGTNKAYAAISNRHTGGDPETSVYLDVKCSKPGDVRISQSASYWRV